MISVIGENTKVSWRIVFRITVDVVNDFGRI
jgi:hypothetical protein